MKLYIFQACLQVGSSVSIDTRGEVETGVLLKRKDTLASRLPLTSQTRSTGEVSELKSLTTSPCSSSSNWSGADPTTTRNRVATNMENNNLFNLAFSTCGTRDISPRGRP